ncbi:MAG TPA: PAS domain S-box protein [Burkholderiales bacterium]|nr:PAS domain S-box protein [Burkholderiales bacterium]
MEDRLRDAALAVSSAEGEQVYEKLLESLASILGVEFALISEYVEPERSRLRTRALHVDGGAGENMEYDLAGTPCESALGREFRIYRDGVRRLFPDNALLREHRIESYAGATLDRAGGHPGGLLIVMSRRPLANEPLVEAMLKIFAARIGAELERERASAGQRASEAQYRAMFDAAADSLILRDAEYRVVDVNPAFLNATRLRREDVVGVNQLLVIPQAERERLFALHQRAIAGEPIQFEAPAQAPDGRMVQVELRGVPMMHEGRPHVLYIGRDITERKAAEDRLRASEEQYRAIFNVAADALVLRDAEFRIVDVNPAYERLSGYTRDEVLGTIELTLRDPDDNRNRLEVHRRVLAGEAAHVETRAMRKDGTRLYLDVYAVPMAYANKPHVLYIGRDITERRAAEARLRASEEQYRAIFNAIDEALVLRDANFKIVDVNHAYEAMSGHRRADVVGQDGLTFSAPENRESRIALHRRALAGEQVQFEVEGRAKDGRGFVVEVRLVPIQYRGEPHVLQIGQEATERRAAESERAQLEAQLRQAQKMEAIGHLTGGIAHDFNNILQGILGNLSLAAERQAELGDARLGKYLERAQHSAQRARELIAQMLTFSRGQRGARRMVSLPDLAHDASKLLRSTLPSTIDLRLSIENAVPAMELDPVQIEQVVLNLCINARDAMGGMGAIRIVLKQAARIRGVCASCRQKVDGRFVELSVRDTGPGIQPQVMDRMFEPFFSTKDVGRGSGMGLSLAHGIVHEHGGHILVDSMPNERTKFQVLLPEPGPGTAVPPEGRAAAQATARARLSGRVLVVDDEQAIREFMADLLGGWGLEVDVLADGAAARDAVARDPQRFDLVITDQTMPQLTGLALARVLRRLRPGLPVILYTGYAEDLSPEELRDAGVLKLVRKPVEPAQFFPILAAHLTAR